MNYSAQCFVKIRIIRKMLDWLVKLFELLVNIGIVRLIRNSDSQFEF